MLHLVSSECNVNGVVWSLFVQSRQVSSFSKWLHPHQLIPFFSTFLPSFLFSKLLQIMNSSADKVQDVVSTASFHCQPDAECTERNRLPISCLTSPTNPTIPQ